MRVLIVEDSRALRDSLRDGLAGEGFAVDVAEDGAVGLSLARNNPYDVLVLDLMLPEVDGFSVLEQLSGAPGRPHVLVLTARDRLEDRVRGLNAGADDYLVKPFAFDELLARIHALVRRRYDESEVELRIGELLVAPQTGRAAHAGEALDLTAREFGLLEYLARRRGQIVSREEIEDHIYGTSHLPSSNAVDSAICILRSKLGPRGKHLIQTRRGRGYVLEEPRA